ncbi:hypothetical protein EXIGLDRAFT_758812 [Exidia glandulosa HHB12029]|uniref:Uncharacterized protein n=1 Tax=Exidia glandulosa HHB12029 TaxID=1314781 RepID=A0A165QDS0_EXIGL|nr:hypothetical protein EXIGLDRAFT_758812 [Exidia glandulosa HHB12029]
MPYETEYIEGRRSTIVPLPFNFYVLFFVTFSPPASLTMFSKTLTFFVAVLAVASSTVGAPAAEPSANGNLCVFSSTSCWFSALTLHTSGKRCSSWDDAFNTGYNDGYWQSMDQQCSHGHQKRTQQHKGKEAEALRNAFTALHGGSVNRRAELAQRDICGDAYSTGYSRGRNTGTQHCYT